MQVSFTNLNSTFDNTLYKALKAGDNFNFDANIKDYIPTQKSSELPNQVFFTDMVSKQKISVNLSNENLASLQKTFGANEVKQNQDGSFELSGKAQNLVAGWFGDIAYQRGYLKADLDKNGSLDSEELFHTKSASGITYQAMLKDNQILVSTQSYTYAQGQEQANMQRAFSNNDDSQSRQVTNSIDKELNFTLSKDKNKDGVLKVGEMVNKTEYETKLKDHLQGAIASIETKQGLSKLSSLPNTSGSSLTIDDILNNDATKNLKELEKLEKEALMKELNLTGNVEDYNLNELKAKVNENLSSLATNIKTDMQTNLSLDIKV